VPFLRCLLLRLVKFITVSVMLVGFWGLGCIIRVSDVSSQLFLASLIIVRGRYRLLSVVLVLRSIGSVGREQKKKK